MYGWIENSLDQAPFQSYTVYFEENGDVILVGLPEHPRPPEVLPGVASVINISKRPRFWNSKAAMMESMQTELVQLSPGVTTIHDADTEQIQFPRYYIDHLLDEGVEIIIPNVIPYIPISVIKKIGIVPQLKLHMNSAPRMAVKQILTSARIRITVSTDPGV